MQTLKQAKKEITMRENRRVFDDMGTPRDIYLEFDGVVYTKKLISWAGGFRWKKWEIAKF